MCYHSLNLFHSPSPFLRMGSSSENKASPPHSSSSKLKLESVIPSDLSLSLSLSSDAMPSTKKTLDQVWTTLSLPSLHPCSGKSDPQMGNEPSDESSTVLSLSTGGSSQHFHSQKNSGICSDYLSEFSSFCKRRGSELDGDVNRHKRKIKNRESAVRSRARRQAYTNELEMEVKRLMEENARIRILLKKLRSSAATEAPKKQKLPRTLSASF